MQPTMRYLVLPLAVLVAFAAGLTGCSNDVDRNEVRRTEAATANIQEFETDVQAVVRQIDATKLSLTELTRPGADVKAAFDTYSDNLDKLETMQADFAKDADEMKARGRDYFEADGKDDDDADDYRTTPPANDNDMDHDTRTADGTDLSVIYSSIAEKSMEAKELFRNFVDEAKQVEDKLEENQTSSAVAAAMTDTREAVAGADNLKEAFQDVQQSINRAKTELYSSGMR